MPKFIIKWNAGYGDTHDVVEAENEDKATEIAFECWKDEAESSAKYSAEEYSEEAADEYGL